MNNSWRFARFVLSKCDTARTIPLVLMILIFGCNNRPLKLSKKVAAVRTKVGIFADDSYYSCLFNGYYQGIGLAQLRQDCSEKLVADDKLGFGRPLREVLGDRKDFFNP